jgi:hypothetical protein
MNGTARGLRAGLAARTGALLLIVWTAACGGNGGGTPTPTPTLTPTPPPATVTPTPEAPAGTFDYEGMNHVAWQSNQYAGAEGTASREALASTGANWAGLLVTWYMQTKDSSAIAPDGQRTPSDASLAEAIQHFHSRGLKVMLKPHVDVNDSTWRGSILPPDTAAWFASYDTFMTQMARFAEAQQVEMLCVGTELARLSNRTYRTQWAQIIANVRANYGGRLTYAANANYAADEFSSVAFWDLLDLGGLDGYVPLTNKSNPTLDELIAAWSRNRDGTDMRSAFRYWQSSHGKPAIFTEIGYRSADGANISPWEWSNTAAYDPNEQLDCYYAAFSVWLEEKSWMKGLFLWSWDVPAPSASDTGYTPRNKPAGTFLQARYSASE